MDFDLISMWLALPFGGSASPGYFQDFAGLITSLHCLHQPVSPIMGSLAFASHMFVDDAMIIEVGLPGRMDQSARVWAQCCVTVLDSGAVSDKKKRAEGTWGGGTHIFLGFRVNVASESISLPEANIEGSNLVICKPDFDPGNTVVPSKSMRELRGIFTHTTVTAARSGKRLHGQ